MNQSEVQSVLGVLSGAYPREITPEVAQLWCNVFSSDDADLVADAVHQWVLNETFFPTPAGLRQVMRAISRQYEPEALQPSTNVATMEQAKAAFSGGYRQSRRKAGDTEEQIEEKLGALLRKWPSIPGVGV